MSTCTYWDTASSSWSSEGCTYWRTDEVNGVAYCNCTHLTSFTSDVSSSLQGSVTNFASTMASAEDLSGKKVLKHPGTIISLVLIWLLAFVLYFYDSIVRRFELMHQALSEKGARRYFNLTSPMFRPNENQTSSARSLIHELRMVRQAAWHHYEQKDRDEVEIHMRGVLRQMEGKTKVFNNWMESLRVDNDIMALFNPESYRRDLFTKRSIFLLVNVLSLLFVTAVYTPAPQAGGFICPGTATQGVGGSGLLPFPENRSGWSMFTWVSSMLGACPERSSTVT